MRLLQVTGTLDPAYGGPPVVLNQLTASLNDLGHTVDVVTVDLQSDPWLIDVPGSPTGVGPAHGRYGYSRRLKDWLHRRVSDYDAVIVHGIWQYQSVAVGKACREARVPYFVFVHGALDPWFKLRYRVKHIKKSMYWRVIEHRILRDATAVLFTREDERTLARSSFTPYQVRESVVDIGVDEPSGDPTLQRNTFLSAFPELKDKRILLFLSRIHPKKGADLLIRAFAEVCEHEPDLQLVIAGPDEANTRNTLESICEELSLGSRITWTGMLSGDIKWGAYRAADVFVLTSHSENFGIVVSEALACGLPVLITNKVNIWREIADAGAGLVEPDTIDGASTLLHRWLALTTAQQHSMRTRARNCYTDNFDAHSAASKFADFLEQAIRPMSPC